MNINNIPGSALIVSDGPHRIQQTMTQPVQSLLTLSSKQVGVDLIFEPQAITDAEHADAPIQE